MCVFSNASGNRGINEKVVCLVAIERVRFVLKVADRKIQLAIVVVVCEGDPHACFCFSRVAAAHAGEQSDFFKSTVPSVFKKEIEILIVGDVDVGITVVVSVANGNAETVRSWNT